MSVTPFHSAYRDLPPSLISVINDSVRDPMAMFTYIVSEDREGQMYGPMPVNLPDELTPEKFARSGPIVRTMWSALFALECQARLHAFARLLAAQAEATETQEEDTE